MPLDIVWRHEDEIYKVMGELAGIVGEENGSSWSDSRKRYLKSVCIHFDGLALVDPNLRPKLTKLVHTWEPEWSLH